MGNFSRSRCSFLKKRGIVMRISFGSRFMGWKVDSRERSFGNTFSSNALLTVVICEHTRESEAVTRMPGGRGRYFAYLCSSYTTVHMVSSRSVSVPSLSIAFRCNGRRVPAVVELFVHLPFQ